jgi:hypothetical protein
MISNKVSKPCIADHRGQKPQNTRKITVIGINLPNEKVMEPLSLDDEWFHS